VEYDISRSAWTILGSAEVWEDDTPVISQYVVGLSFGAQSDIAGT
jgi:hypothetical protein